MPNIKYLYRTIRFDDIHRYPDWDLVSRYTKYRVGLVCERSGQLMENCENKQCSDLMTHKTRQKEMDIEMAVICKKDD